MYILKVEHSFDSAHFLADYEGKCKNIHGHRWRVEAEVYSETLLEEGQLKGMVVDFGDLKKDVKELLDSYDHALIFETNTLKSKTKDCLTEEGFNLIEVNFRPTAENFSKFFYDKLKNMNYQVLRVTVYETPNNSATYQNGMM